MKRTIALFSCLLIAGSAFAATNAPSSCKSQIIDEVHTVHSVDGLGGETGSVFLMSSKGMLGIVHPRGPKQIRTINRNVYFEGGQLYMDNDATDNKLLAGSCAGREIPAYGYQFIIDATIKRDIKPSLHSIWKTKNHLATPPQCTLQVMPSCVQYSKKV